MNRRTITALFVFVLAAHAVSPTTAARFLLRRETNVISELANANPKTEDGDRNLKKDDAYIEPVWFDSYKEIAGKAFKRCKPLNNVAPVDGSACTQMKVGDYICAFEDQTCPDGSIHPKIKCDCNIGTGGGVWSCEEYKPCEVTPPVTTCPAKHPISFNPPMTCSEGMICPIGTKRCCGKVFPRFVCTCMDGVFDCKDDKSCSGKCPPKSNSAENAAMLPIRPNNVTTGENSVTPENPAEVEKPAESEKQNSTFPPAGKMETCPNPGSLTPPTTGTECTLDRSELCHYDKICCCDKCDDRFSCSCEDGKWQCVELAYRCAPCNNTTSEQPIETKPPATTISPGAETCPNPDSLVPPEDGTKCSIDPTEVCHYDKTCCCDDCMDRFTCTCVDGTWQCAEIAVTCMGQCPPAINGKTCDAGSVVEEGQTECCGSILPIWRCRCGGEGTYECILENSPLNACLCAGEPPVEVGAKNETDSGNATTTGATCPNPDSIVPPEDGSKCSLDPSQICHYDKTCCCDDCMDRFTCTCVDGVWQCGEVAMGCMGPCPPSVTGTTCDAGSVVEEGQTECCGSILPVWRCRCGSAGTYECTMEHPPWMMCSCAMEPPVEAGANNETMATPPPEDLAVTCPNPDSLVPPESGSKCGVDPTQVCHYDKTCCCDDCIDRFSCTCVDGAWQCAEVAMSCMGPCPPAIKGTTCDAGSVVEEGETECCGSILPVWRCRCGSAGTYECILENPPWMMCSCAMEPPLEGGVETAAPTAGKNVPDSGDAATTSAPPPGDLSGTCPNPDSIVPPEDGSKCSVDPTLTCHYDKTCCCDVCGDRFYCDCVDGAWQCLERAMSCMGPCPPAVKGTTCEAGSMVEDGEKECCGSILPVWVCRCGSAGVYECTMENSPRMMCMCAQPTEEGNIAILP